MQMIGVLLLAAATAGAGFGKPGVGGKKLLRHHAVVSADAPPGGPLMPPQGPGGPGAEASGRRFPNVRSQIFFLDPDGMKIGWQTSSGPGGEKAYLPAQLEVPARYNFMQGYIYRLKITDIPNRPGTSLYPTLEVAPSTPATDAYLTHNPIPVQFTPEDFEQVIDGGNFVTKVIYLPDPKYQELAIAGVETLVSTRLEPGVDPILEADKRGTILLIVRLGQIDLEMQQGGAPIIGGPVNAAPVLAPNAATVPGSLPAGVIESAPVTPAPTAVPADAPPAVEAPGLESPLTPEPPSATFPPAEGEETPEAAAALEPPFVPEVAEVPVPVPAPN